MTGPSPDSAPDAGDSARQARGPGPGCSFLLALLLMPLMWSVRSCGYESFSVPSGSMEPTLRIGDKVLVQKFAYGLRLPFTRVFATGPEVPERGDVVVFIAPGTIEPNTLLGRADLPFHATSDYIKRVVGLPGDTVAVRDGAVVINGKAARRKELGPYRYTDADCNNHPTVRYEEALPTRPHVVLEAADPGKRKSDWGPEKVPKGKVFVLGDQRDRSKDGRSIGFVDVSLIKGQATHVWWSVPGCTAKGEGPGVRWKRVWSPVQ